MLARGCFEEETFPQVTRPAEPSALHVGDAEVIVYHAFRHGERLPSISYHLLDWEVASRAAWA